MGHRRPGADFSSAGARSGDLRQLCRAERRANLAAIQIDQLTFQRGGEDRAPIARTRAAADDRQFGDLRAGFAQRVQAVSKRKGDTFEHGGTIRAGVGLVVEAQKCTANMRVVVRGAFAGKIRQKQLRARRGPAASARGENFGGTVDARQRAAQSMQLAAERCTAIWCHRPGRQWQKACTAPAGLGRNLRVATKITPDVPSDSSAWPSAITRRHRRRLRHCRRRPRRPATARHAPARRDLIAQRAGRLRCLHRAAACGQG